MVTYSFCLNRSSQVSELFSFPLHVLKKCNRLKEPPSQFTSPCCQAVFSQSEGMEGDGSTETQYTYYPASIADATTGTMVTTVQASDTLLGQTTPTGKCLAQSSDEVCTCGSSGCYLT